MPQNQIDMKKLDLGKELSKNAQKKVLGGAQINCISNCPPYDYLYFNIPFLTCASAASYCAGQHATYAFCSE